MMFFSTFSSWADHPFIHSQKEEREHEAGHQEHGGTVPDTATGKQVGWEAHRRCAGNKQAGASLGEGQLCLDFGKGLLVLVHRPFYTSFVLRASMARGYLRPLWPGLCCGQLRRPLVRSALPASIRGDTAGWTD